MVLDIPLLDGFELNRFNSGLEKIWSIRRKREFDCNVNPKTSTCLFEGIPQLLAHLKVSVGIRDFIQITIKIIGMRDYLAIMFN